MLLALVISVPAGLDAELHGGASQQIYPGLRNKLWRTTQPN